MDKLDKIQNILDKVVNENWYQYSFKVKLIQTHWLGIVGEKLSKFTFPYRIYNQILYVRCSHQGWIQTLQFHKKQILEKIQNLFNDKRIVIQDVRFTFGQIHKTVQYSSKTTDNDEPKRKEVDKDNKSFKVLKNLLNQFFER